jgi:hypothetical protein
MVCRPNERRSPDSYVNFATGFPYGGLVLRHVSETVYHTWYNASEVLDSCCYEVLVSRIVAARILGVCLGGLVFGHFSSRRQNALN